MTLHPRGIVKWHPFASINDPVAFGFEIDRMNNIQPMVELSEQQLEVMQADLERAIHEDKTIMLHYYEYPEIKRVQGKISKIDAIERMVTIDHCRISIDMICFLVAGE